MSVADTFFVYSGYSSTSFGLWVKREGVHMPLLPELRDRYAEISTMHGVYDYGSYYGPYKFSIDVFLIEADRSALNAKLDALQLVLDPRLGARPFVLSDRPTKQWMAKIDGPVDFAPVNAGAAQFTLPWICPNPFPTGI